MRNLLIVLCCLIAAVALGQSLPFPGPGTAHSVAAACAPNTDGGGTYANVVRLYHFDNATTDNSPNAKAGTINSTSFSTAQFKFGTHSLLASNGSGTGFTTQAWSLGSAAMTIEAWVYLNGNTTGNALMGDVDNAVSGITRTLRWTIATGAAGWNVFTNGSSITMVSTNSMATGSWHHYAWARDGSAVNFMYVDGTSVAFSNNTSSSDAVGNVAYNMAVGSTSYTGSSARLDGYIDELRISNMRRYTSNFTPPTQPFCNS